MPMSALSVIRMSVNPHCCRWLPRLNRKLPNYPFTTREPIVGVVGVEFENFVLAEIPGLIDGAHLGRGLGHDFLRHSMRTRVLIHLIDGTAESPLDNMIKVNNELSLFDSQLARKPQIVVINKIDLPEVQDKEERNKKVFPRSRHRRSFYFRRDRRGYSRINENRQ